MEATKRLPLSLCVPKLTLRHNTAPRRPLSAGLLVGSMPSTRTNVHNATSRASNSRHVAQEALETQQKKLSDINQLLKAFYEASTTKVYSTTSDSNVLA